MPSGHDIRLEIDGGVTPANIARDRGRRGGHLRRRLGDLQPARLRPYAEMVTIGARMPGLPLAAALSLVCQYGLTVIVFSPFANRRVGACTIGVPQILEKAVQTALRNSIDLLSMREVTCWRW